MKTALLDGTVIVWPRPGIRMNDATRARAPVDTTVVALCPAVPEGIALHVAVPSGLMDPMAVPAAQLL